MEKHLNIETLPIGEVHSDPANVRQHPQESISAIKASLQRFGLQKPLVIDAKNVVRAGNGTLQAAKELGWEKIDCVRSDLSGSELTAYSIADNSIAELSCFSPQVADVLNDLKAELPDLSPDFKFDELIAEFTIPADAVGQEFDESCADDVEMLTCPHCEPEALCTADAVPAVQARRESLADGRLQRVQERGGRIACWGRSALRGVSFRAFRTALESEHNGNGRGKKCPVRR